MTPKTNRKAIAPLRLVTKHCKQVSVTCFVDVLECGHRVIADANRDVEPTRRRCRECAKSEAKGAIVDEMKKKGSDNDNRQ